MQKGFVLAFAAGLLVGAAALLLLRPPCPAGSPAPAAAASLVDGKYLVVQSESGHWIYERDHTGTLKSPRKEMSAAGMQAIWQLQSSYLPQALSVGGESILSVPATRYSTETGQFQVVHKFYRSAGGKLVEMPMEPLAPAATPSPPANR